MHIDSFVDYLPKRAKRIKEFLRKLYISGDTVGYTGGTCRYTAYCVQLFRALNSEPFCE